MTDSSSIVKIVSWNIARRAKCWERLIDMGADVALLQEAAETASGARGPYRCGSCAVAYGRRGLRSTACMAHGGREALESRPGGVDRGKVH